MDERTVFKNDGSFLEQFKTMTKGQVDGFESSKLSIAIKPKVEGISSTGTITKPKPSIFKEDEDCDPSKTHSFPAVLTKDSVSAAAAPSQGGKSQPDRWQKHAFTGSSQSVAVPAAPSAAGQLQVKLEEPDPSTPACSQPIPGPRKRSRWDTSSIPAGVPGPPQACAVIDPGPSSSGSASTNVYCTAGTSSEADFTIDMERIREIVKQKAASAFAEDEIKKKQELDAQKLNEMYLKILADQQLKEARKLALLRAGKNMHEYDSDEDSSSGTWEHTRRMKEMEKTRERAEELTKAAEGKHFIGDFLPPDELEKFQEAVKLVKDGAKQEVSDYASNKISMDNVGYKLLQKAGWTEGRGLGARENGITQPVNKSTQSHEKAGIGVRPSELVNPEDDDFELYRKRMMLAYKFRPNPLNNPRRHY